MSVALKAAAWTWRFKESKKDSPVHRTPGSRDSPVIWTILDLQRVRFCDSPVYRTPGVLTHKVLKSLESPVHRTPGSLDSLVPRTPRSLDSPVLGTPGSLDSPVLRALGSLDSPALWTLLDFHQINNCDSPVPVLRTPGVILKCL